jgi:hypothetical protein
MTAREEYNNKRPTWPQPLIDELGLLSMKASRLHNALWDHVTQYRHDSHAAHAAWRQKYHELDDAYKAAVQVTRDFREAAQAMLTRSGKDYHMPVLGNWPSPTPRH